jgi:hypothetical protein
MMCFVVAKAAGMSVQLFTVPSLVGFLIFCFKFPCRACFVDEHGYKSLTCVRIFPTINNQPDNFQNLKGIVIFFQVQSLVVEHDLMEVVMGVILDKTRSFLGGRLQ